MRYKLSIFILLMLSLSLFLLFNPSLTGFLSLDSNDVEFNLSQDTYVVNDTLDGVIKLFLNGDIYSDSLLKINIDGSNVVSETIEDVLDLSLFNTGLDGGGYNVNNQATEQTVEISGSLFGFKIPVDSVIEGFSFDVTGLADSNNVFPEDIEIDVGDDGVVDWYYLGNFIRFGTEIKPNGLSDNSGDDALIDCDTDVNCDSNLYCELFDLNFIDKIKINVDYEIVDGTGALTGTILKFDNEDYVHTTQFADCDLPNDNSEKSCIIEADELISDQYLACVYNDASNGKYNIKKDDDSLSGYVCDATTLIQGSSSCDKSLGDFRITLSESVYNNVLNSKTNFNDWKLVDVDLDELMGSSDCDDTECVIPLKIDFTDGKIQLSNVKIRYSLGGSLSESKNIYTVNYERPLITSIDGSNIINLSIEIPLSIFEIGVQESGNVEVSVGGISIDQDFTVVENYGDVFSSDIENIISNIQDIKDMSNSESIVDTYLTTVGIDIDTILQNLNTYVLQVEAIDSSSNLSSDDKINQILLLQQGISGDLNIVPGSIVILDKISNVPLQSPLDINPNYLDPDVVLDDVKNQILEAQENVNVDSIIANLEVDGVIVTVISRSISSSIGDFYVIEDIPKNVALNTDDLIYPDNVEVLINDPVIKFNLQNSGEVNYVILNDALLDASSITSLIVPVTLGGNIESPIGPICGDNICTDILEDSKTCPKDCGKKIPWTFLIILFIIILIGAYYLNFYKGKWNFKQVKSYVVKKPHFHKESDIEALKIYMQKSLHKSIKFEKIKEILLSKGWTKEQVDYVYDQIQK